jgi:hypothetical protein
LIGDSISTIIDLYLKFESLSLSVLREPKNGPVCLDKFNPGWNCIFIVRLKSIFELVIVFISEDVVGNLELEVERHVDINLTDLLDSQWRLIFLDK